MITIYKIKSDYTGHTLTPVDHSVLLVNDSFRLKRMRPGWNKPSFYVHDPVQTRDTDFYHVRTGTFAFKKSAYESDLGEILEHCAEILPAIREDTKEEFYILNPLACYNCLNTEKAKFRTTPDGKVVVQIFDYVFHPERIGGESVFKIPGTYLTELYVSSGIVGPSDEFFHAYHEGGYTGLKFEKVWSENK